MAICSVIENLLDVKRKQIEVEQELNSAREPMIVVSYQKDPFKWTELFTKATNVSMRLANINCELARLQHTHVMVTNGVLPY